MKIKQDPVTKLWCRNNGAVLMPPNGYKYATFRWTFGCKIPMGYKQIKFQRKTYLVHQLICRAFHGLAPDNKPLVDHINRVRDDNRPENLHWVSCKENSDNQSSVDRSIAKYKVRQCENKAAYGKVYYETHREERKRHMRAWYTAHPEKHRAYAKAWYEAHCEEARAYAKAYRKRRKASQSLGVNSTMYTP